MTWNPSVPDARRFAGKNTPGRSGGVTHVVCHITGENDFEKVKAEFLTEVSAHYVIDKTGLVYQFVEEENQAWHAGIKASVQTLYAKPPAEWRRYLYYFDWETYPADAVYLDAMLQPVAEKARRVFVRQANGTDWSQYAYFKTRWGDGAQPVNYATSPRPNNYSVGIEILSLGAKTADPAVYTEAMYVALSSLVADICARHGIPQEKGRVVGHEDVNPVQRWGWDPNQGFDWTRVWA